jgi:hypothetical protein
MMDFALSRDAATAHTSLRTVRAATVYSRSFHLISFLVSLLSVPSTRQPQTHHCPSFIQPRPPTIKMRASIITVTCPLLALCAAQPFDGKSSKLSNTTSTSCISPADATLIANGFGQILSNFSMSFGDVLIADDYVDQSDSVATLMHSPNLLASDVCSPFFFF